MHSASISIVVPARNEEDSVAQVIVRSLQAIDELQRSGEVLVVNDGSTDGTASVLFELANRFEQVHVLLIAVGWG